MPIPVVYARATSSITMPEGHSVVVHHGQHWPADDPIVQDHPDLFTADPRYGMAYSMRPRYMDLAPDAPLDEVEEATAVPGERRSVRRRRAETEF